MTNVRLAQWMAISIGLFGLVVPPTGNVAAAPKTCKGTKVLYRGKCVYPNRIPKRINTKKRRKTGTLGGVCYPNRTCNKGLVCRKNACLPKPRAKDGTRGGPCYGNNTCNKGLTCLNKRCRRIEVRPGTKDGPCYGNNTCNKGLSCIKQRCSVKQKPSVKLGQLNGPCFPNQTCNSGLVCVNKQCQRASNNTAMRSGIENGPCNTGGTCDAGLRCESGFCKKIPGYNPLSGTWQLIQTIASNGRRTSASFERLVFTGNRYASITKAGRNTGTWTLVGSRFTMFKHNGHVHRRYRCTLTGNQLILQRQTNQSGWVFRRQRVNRRELAPSRRKKPGLRKGLDVMRK